MNADQESPEPGAHVTRVFDDILSPMAFMRPETLQPSGWQEHIPFAFWLIDRAMPRVFVELGTLSGNSYLAFCQAVKALELPTRCYAVDTWQGDAHTGSYGDDVYWALVNYHDCRYASFSRLLRTTFDGALEHFDDGSIDLLHIDGLHTYEAMRYDFESWRPKLSSRAVVLFHDTNVRERGFGGTKLWTELVDAYPHNFQFLHCCGLGVLGVGTDLPVAVGKFFAAARTADGTRLIRDVYGRLGTHCTATAVQQLPQP